MTTKTHPPTKAWAGDWKARVRERLRALGYGTVTELHASRPTLSVMGIADALDVDPRTGARAHDVVADQVAELWREEARANGPEAIERMARMALVGELHRALPGGWMRAWDADGASRVSNVSPTWTGWLEPGWRQPALAVWRALLTSGVPHQGWLPVDGDDPILDRFFRQYWSLSGSESAEAEIVFEQGNEYAPDDPWGAEQIAVTNAGGLRYERLDRGTRTEATGSIDKGQLERIHSLLGISTFPDVPEHRFPPGASLVKLTVKSAGGDASEAVFDRYFASELPGYGPLVALFDALAAAIRARDVAALTKLGVKLS